jgi:hypothetical protein
MQTLSYDRVGGPRGRGVGAEGRGANRVLTPHTPQHSADSRSTQYIENTSSSLNLSLFSALCGHRAAFDSKLCGSR